MIQILADNYIKQEHTNDFLAVANQLIEASRQEEGNISYNLIQDINDPEHFVFIEQWKDQDAIDTHNASTHFTTLVPQMRQYTSKPGAIHLYKSVAN